MRQGWLIAFAGMGLNLTLGVLYAWSVSKITLVAPVAQGGYGWTYTMATSPYALSIVIWAVMMIPAGRLQDKFGPRIIATTGAIVFGLGLYVTSFLAPVPEGFDALTLGFWDQITLALPAILGIGVLAGGGIGLGYACAIPAAIKWFPPTMKGRATGVVVAGIGLATVYIAPLASHLIGAYGIVTLQSEGVIVAGFMFAALLSLFNAAGRVASGFLCDKLGANRTLMMVCSIQILVMLAFPHMTTLTGFIIVTALCGFSYGSCMPLFPTISAGFWGTKNLGMNYGLLYTAWGVAGVVCAVVSAYIKDTTGQLWRCIYLCCFPPDGYCYSWSCSREVGRRPQSSFWK